MIIGEVFLIFSHSDSINLRCRNVIKELLLTDDSNWLLSYSECQEATIRDILL